MRNITTGERARQTAGHANYYLRVEVKDSASNWRDLTNLLGVDWVDGVTWSASIDSPVMTGTVTLKRASSTFSLSPLLTGSALNNLLGTYSPLLDVGRAIRISTATTAHAVAPVTGDYKEVFLGLITDIDFGADPITLTIADLGEALVDTIIEQVRTYGDTVGVAVEAVMQNIIDDNVGAGLFTVFTPVSPNFQIVSTPQATYSPTRGPLMDVLTALALQIGWSFRFHYDSSDVFRPTLFSPDRAKTTPDAIITADEYLDVRRLSISNADIKNVCVVTFQDKVTGLIISAPPVTDPGSIAEFGRRYMEIGEGSSSQIDTLDEAIAMATAAVTDLADPAADQEIESFYLWQIDLGDLLQFNANGVHYDANQAFGVIAYSHTLSGNTHRTTVQVRGQVTGALKQWLLTRNGAFTGRLITGPAPQIPPLLAELNAFQDATRDGMAWQQVIFESSAVEIDIYAVETVGPDVPIPELSATRLAYALKRQDGDKWNAPDQAFIVGIATRANYYRKTVSVGVDKNGQRGATVMWEAQAIDVGTAPTGPPTAFAVAASGDTNRATWTTGDAAAFTLLFRNGYGIVLEPGVVAFLDTRINPSVPYTYQICHWRSGQSSALSAAITIGASITSPNAPSWQTGFPLGTGTASVDYRWTTAAGTTEVAVEISTTAIIGLFFPLSVYTDAGHIPTGTLVDTSTPGLTVQARIRALVGGANYYSPTVNVTYGAAAPDAPKFVNGTPFNNFADTRFQWTTATTTATQLTITVSGIGIIYTTTVLSAIQAGSYFYTAGDLSGKTAFITATYPGGVKKSSIPAVINGFF